MGRTVEQGPEHASQQDLRSNVEENKERKRKREEDVRRERAR
jgi:hypothetical protein